jgi:hypothetical protein
MASTWGALTIKFSVYNYFPPFTPGGLIRIDLLPDHSSPTTAAQVLQQTNTGKKTVRGTLIFDAYADYTSMEDDKIAGTTRTLVAPGETGATYAIEELGEPDYRQSNAIFASVTFVEA